MTPGLGATGAGDPGKAHVASPRDLDFLTVYCRVGKKHPETGVPKG